MTQYQWTIERIKGAHKRSGGYFFSAGAMRGFKSRVSNIVYQGPGGVYFVTSERGPGGVRFYTARKFDRKTKDIANLLQCPLLESSRYTAHKVAAELAHSSQ